MFVLLSVNDRRTRDILLSAFAVADGLLAANDPPAAKLYAILELFWDGSGHGYVRRAKNVEPQKVSYPALCLDHSAR